MTRKKRPAIEDQACERALIASVVHYTAKTLPIVRDIVTEADFFQYRHALVYRTVCALYDTQQKVDAYTVGAALATMVGVESDAEYLASLKDGSFVIQNVDAYAKRVAETALVRRTVEQLSKLVNSADFSTTGAQDWLSDVEAFRAVKAEKIGGQAEVTPALAVSKTMIHELNNNIPDYRLPSPWGAVNDMLNGGYAPGLHLVAARPGGGKSVVLQQTAVKWGKCQPKPILFVSMEMSARDIMRRMVAQEMGFSLSDIIYGSLDEKAMFAYKLALDDIGQLPIRFLCSGSITAQRIAQEATLLHKTTGLAGVVVDYIGLVKWADGAGKFENRREVVGEIAHLLTALGNDLGVPVLAAVQMNRAIESRSTRDPQLSDLRECGDLEQDAYTVHFPITPGPQDNDQEEAKFVIAKHRNGDKGFLRMRWEGPFVRFT